MKVTMKQWILIVFFFSIISTGYGLLFNQNIGWFKYFGLVGPLMVAGIIGKLVMYENKIKHRRY